jgi:hypothetical protein
MEEQFTLVEVSTPRDETPPEEQKSEEKKPTQ